MPEPEVLYSDIKFIRPEGNANVATSSAAETTYSEVKILNTRGPAELPGSKQPAASDRRSGVTTERVALLALSVLLAAALITLGLGFYQHTQTKKSLQELQVKHDAKILSATLQTPKGVEPGQCPPVNNEQCPRCKDAWEQHGGRSYFFYSAALPWNESRKRCRELGGDLVVINSEEEQRFLLSRLKDIMDHPEDKFWIGLTDSEKEAEWRWVDNTPPAPSLTFWLEDEPDNWNREDPDGEDCVRMGETTFYEDLKTWVDKSCKSPHKSICEKPV
ncbi:hepatic lectin-like isoform X1 [Paralichthys olivaceus]|uniref:hepatic lectin-like isoform X1 n=1 Tax=Paralichthys olivaceus TaxID=8255 RepID=UPI0037523C2F